MSVNPLTLTMATIVAVVALFVTRVPILDLIELRTYDLRFLARGTRQPSPAVVLTMIDEKSLDAEGRWPWPRSKLAALVDRISEDGAKVIALDIGFLEPDQKSELELLDRVDRTVAQLGLSGPEMTRFLEESRKRVDHDAALTRAILDSPAAVVLGYFFHMDSTALAFEIDQREIDRRLALLAPSKYPIVVQRGGVDRAVAPRAYAPEINFEAITEAAESSGYFTVRQDADGIVRWMPLVIQAGDEFYPPLAVLAAWHYLDRPQLRVNVGRYGIESIEIGDRSIPTDESGRSLINYYGPPETFAHVSASDVLAGKTPAGTFRDRIALIGATATGINDVRATPFNTSHPGAEIHATMIENILSRDFLAKPRWASSYDVAAIVALAVIAGLALPRLHPLVGLLVAASLCVVHVLATRELFVRHGVWLSVTYPLLALAVSYTLLTAHRFLHEQRERRKIRSAFGHYVAPIVVEAMLKEPGRLRLGGEEKVLTVLFSDLQGFTAASEKYSPQQMIELLSEYYARMTERIFAREGMLKEYVGDELMAIFGAPIDHPDHAQRACLAALEMRSHRHAMSEEWVKLGRPPLFARTGVNSGRMLVGNLGSEYRFAYGVLGDNVNLGSRLEGLNKEYGTEILIGENTAELLQNGFVLREVDMVRVVGKNKPTRIYELIAVDGASLPQHQHAALQAYAAALQAYRAQRWNDAAVLFDQVRAHVPADGPSATMIRRCRSYHETPPPPDWDGVFEATRK